MYQVMLVDDEKMIINSLALGFDWKESGFEVVATATNSTEALKMIEFIRPDIVFTDIKMVGMSGIELMEKVKEILPQIKFVVISGYADFEYAQKAIHLGALAYCLKPLENEEIAEILTLARRGLDNAQAVIQSSFEKLLQQPCIATSEAFLSCIYSEDELKTSLCVAIAVGSAHSLLSGNVCYTPIAVSEECNIYLISSNAEYLDGFSFQTALLTAAADKRIKAFTYYKTDHIVEYLASELPLLINEVYTYFINENNRTLGRIERVAVQQSEPEAIGKLLAATNKNRIVEVLELLSTLTDDEKNSFRGSDAVTLFNLCTTLLARIQNVALEQKASYCFDLAERYDNLNSLIGSISEKISLQIYGNVDLDRIYNETFKKVLQYVNANFSVPISFQQICTDFCINSSYLSQLFKKEIGITFTGYVKNLRINYAKELLEGTGMLVSEISEKVGYDYYFNFAKLFKKETGLTPKQYRDGLSNK